MIRVTKRERRNLNKLGNCYCIEFQELVHYRPPICRILLKYTPILERMPHAQPVANLQHVAVATTAARLPESLHLGFDRRPVGTDRVDARVARRWSTANDQHA